MKKAAGGTANEVLEVARQVIWFMEPEDAVADVDFFLAHLMTYGTEKEIAQVKGFFDESDFLHALENAAPGVFDERSWSYWNVKFGRIPIPPRPKRCFLTNEQAETLHGMGGFPW